MSRSRRPRLCDRFEESRRGLQPGACTAKTMNCAVEFLRRTAPANLEIVRSPSLRSEMTFLRNCLTTPLR